MQDKGQIVRLFCFDKFQKQADMLLQVFYMHVKVVANFVLKMQQS